MSVPSGSNSGAPLIPGLGSSMPPMAPPPPQVNVPQGRRIPGIPQNVPITNNLGGFGRNNRMTDEEAEAKFTALMRTWNIPTNDQGIALNTLLGYFDINGTSDKASYFGQYIIVNNNRCDMSKLTPLFGINVRKWARVYSEYNHELIKNTPTLFALIKNTFNIQEDAIVPFAFDFISEETLAKCDPRHLPTVMGVRSARLYNTVAVPEVVVEPPTNMPEPKQQTSGRKGFDQNQY